MIDLLSMVRLRHDAQQTVMHITALTPRQFCDAEL